MRLTRRIYVNDTGLRNGGQIASTYFFVLRTNRIKWLRFMGVFRLFRMHLGWVEIEVRARIGEYIKMHSPMIGLYRTETHLNKQ